MATEATQIVHDILTEYSNSGDRFRCATVGRRLTAEWDTRHPRPDRIPADDLGMGWVLPDGVTEAPGCPPAAGEFLPYLPDEAPARLGDQNKTSKLNRAGVYCSDRYREHVRPFVLAAVPPQFRRPVVQGTRGVGMFACYTRQRPNQISVFSYCGTNSMSDILRVLLLPEAVTDYAARSPSSDLVGLCRSDEGWRVMPDALMETGHDALGVRCIDDPECGLMTAFGLVVAGDGLCPDAATTRLVRAADKGERGRLERRRVLLGAVTELARLGVPVPVPAESAAAAEEIAARCLDAAIAGLLFPLGRGLWLTGVRRDIVGTPGTDSRAPNPDYIPPEGVTWREYTPTYQPGLRSYFTWWREGDADPRGDYGGDLTGESAARAWREIATQMTSYAARWAAAGN